MVIIPFLVLRYFSPLSTAGISEKKKKKRKGKKVPELFNDRKRVIRSTYKSL